MVANVRRTQAELPVPIALEPIAALFDWPDDELDEAEFLTEILDRTGALLLLDIANVLRQRPQPGHRPARRCSTGCRWTGSPTCTWPAAPSSDGFYHDTHTDPVPADGARPGRRALRPAPAAGPAAGARRALPAGGPRRAGRCRAPNLPDAPAIAAVTRGRTGGHDRRRRHRVPTRPAVRPTCAGRRNWSRRWSPARRCRPGFAPAPVDAARRGAAAQAGRRGGPALAAARRRPRRRAGRRTFTDWAAGRPTTGSLRDGWDLARELRAAARCRRSAREELAAREASARYDGRRAPRPRRLPGRAPGPAAPSRCSSPVGYACCAPPDAEPAGAALPGTAGSAAWISDSPTGCTC